MLGVFVSGLGGLCWIGGGGIFGFVLYVCGADLTLMCGGPWGIGDKPCPSVFGVLEGYENGLVWSSVLLFEFDCDCELLGVLL